MPRIARRDDLAHPVLVEALEAVVALEDLEVRAERAVAAEGVGLAGGYRADGEQASDPLRRNRPALAGGEALAQVRDVGERLHGLDAERGELGAGVVEGEGRLEVVHAGLQHRLAVERAPQ